MPTNALQHAYHFTYSIHTHKGEVSAISCAQAVSRAKAAYVAYVMGFPIGSAKFKIAMLNLRESDVKLSLDPIARQRFAELYREAYHIGISDVPTKAEFSQLQTIITTLANLKGPTCK